MKTYYLFFTTILFIYFVMHIVPYYIYISMFPRHKNLGLFFILGLLPIILRLLDINIPLKIKQLLLLISYIWIGFVFYLFLFSLLIFIFKLLRFNLLLLKAITIFAFISCIILVIVGYYNAKFIKITNYKIKTSKTDKNYKILFLSDIHIDIISHCDIICRQIKKIVQMESPDIIILGGDIFDSHLDHIQDIILEFFNNISDGKVFFVFGNHEHYTNNISEIKKVLKEHRIILLQNTNYELNNINLIGVDDPAFHNKYSKQLFYLWLNQIKSYINKQKFNILISHRPWGFDFIVKNNIELEISGHTHNGQIFPFNYIVKLYYPYIYGKYKKKNSTLIVSSGFGTWGPPLRILTRSEAVTIELIKQE